MAIFPPQRVTFGTAWQMDYYKTIPVFRVTITYHTIAKAERPFLSVQFNSANELTGKNPVIYGQFAIFNELVGNPPVKQLVFGRLKQNGEY